MAVLSKSKQLKKELTLFNIYSIATGATIASGFFLLPGLAFAQAGPAMIFSYLIAAIPVIPALFSSAELSTAMPRAGGEFFFLDRSMGPLLGTIGGLGTWLALILKTSFALIGIGAYTAILLPQVPILPLAIFFAIMFGLINLMGAKKAGMFQGILVTGLLLLLGWLTSNGLISIDMHNFTGFYDADLNSIFATAGLVYVSYVGLSKIASVSEEVKNPERNIPLAMFLALGTAMTVYVAGTFVMIGNVPPETLTNDLTPVATTARLMIGPWGSVLMTVAAILAFFSVTNAGILSCSRYPLAMSRDHLMPKFLSSITKRKTPKYAIMISVFIIILILVLFDPTKIAKLAGSFQLLILALLSIAVIVMRESRLDSYDPGFRSPLYPWMQIFGIVAAMWLIFQMGLLAVLSTLVFIGVGTIWYFYYGRHRVVRDGAIYHIFARLGQRRFEGLDIELRSILKEKGLREQDPFDAVVASSIFIDLDKDADFAGIVHLASEYLAKRLDQDIESLEKSFFEGTQVGATPVSHGAALPHIRVHGIVHSELIIVRSKQGTKVDFDKSLFGGQDIDRPINAFFFLASPDDNPGQHLRILAQIASHVDSEEFLDRWLAARNEQELKELLLREDRYISLMVLQGTRTDEMIDRQIRDLDLPDGSLIALIHRRGEMLVPTGKTVLMDGDRLTIISYPKGIQELYTRYLAE